MNATFTHWTKNLFDMYKGLGTVGVQNIRPQLPSVILNACSEAPDVPVSDCAEAQQ